MYLYTTLLSRYWRHNDLLILLKYSILTKLSQRWGFLVYIAWKEKSVNIKDLHKRSCLKISVCPKAGERFECHRMTGCTGPVALLTQLLLCNRCSNLLATPPPYLVAEPWFYSSIHPCALFYACRRLTGVSTMRRGYKKGFLTLKKWPKELTIHFFLRHYFICLVKPRNASVICNHERD